MVQTGEPVQQAAAAASVQAVAVPPQPTQAAMSVTLPAGVAAGQMLNVQTPDGQTLGITVPENATAGQQLNVSYTPLAVSATPAVVTGTPVS